MFSLTTREAPTTADENNDHPLVSAPIGFSWKSDNEGAAADERPYEGFCDGEGVLPKPWYRPPCDGGRSSGREALASPRVAK